jgi:hypothetical protein
LHVKGACIAMNSTTANVTDTKMSAKASLFSINGCTAATEILQITRAQICLGGTEIGVAEEQQTCFSEALMTNKRSTELLHQ